MYKNVYRNLVTTKISEVTDFSFANITIFLQFPKV